MLDSMSWRNFWQMVSSLLWAADVWPQVTGHLNIMALFLFANCQTCPLCITSIWNSLLCSKRWEIKCIIDTGSNFMGHQYPLVHRAVCLRLSVKGLLTAGTGAQPSLLLLGAVSRQDFILRHNKLNIIFSTSFFFFFCFSSQSGTKAGTSTAGRCMTSTGTACRRLMTEKHKICW